MHYYSRVRSTYYTDLMHVIPLIGICTLGSTVVSGRDDLDRDV